MDFRQFADDSDSDSENNNRPKRISKPIPKPSPKKRVSFVVPQGEKTAAELLAEKVARKGVIAHESSSTLKNQFTRENLKEIET